MRGIPEPEIVQVESMIAFSVLTFAWYKFDSDIRGYKRSPLLNVGVINKLLHAMCEDVRAGAMALGN
jgi:hypothetical protein